MFIRVYAFHESIRYFCKERKKKTMEAIQVPSLVYKLYAHYWKR